MKFDRKTASGKVNITDTSQALELSKHRPVIIDGSMRRDLLEFLDDLHTRIAKEVSEVLHPIEIQRREARKVIRIEQIMRKLRDD